ncbi:MAG TPA: DUF2207 domain-containing protein, partial [Epsilonproteobacteria bacterium]|nr:DUF2207 domain-containing protein [Campylobacterota bacterium]
RFLSSWYWPTMGGFLLYLFSFYKKHVGIIDKRSIAPRYYPPEGMDVLQSGLIYDRFADNDDYAAAILELAQKGYLEIFQEKKGDDTFLKKSDKSTSDLPDDLKYLMNGVLFTGDSSSHLLKKKSQSEASRLKEGFKTINEMLYQWSAKEGYMRENPQKVRKGFLIKSILILIPIILLAAYTMFKLYDPGLVMLLFFSSIFIGVGLSVALTQKSIFQKLFGLLFAVMGSGPALSMLGSSATLEALLFSPMTAVVIILIGIYVTYRHLGAYTHKGAYTHTQLLGLKEFMTRVKEDEIRRRLKDDPLYLDKALPYAVLFGVTRHWLKLYDTLQVSYPIWYHGSPAYLGDFSSGVGSAATPPPQAAAVFRVAVASPEVAAVAAVAAPGSGAAHYRKAGNLSAEAGRQFR